LGAGVQGLEGEHDVGWERPGEDEKGQKPGKIRTCRVKNPVKKSEQVGALGGGRSWTSNSPPFKGEDVCMGQLPGLLLCFKNKKGVKGWLPFANNSPINGHGGAMTHVKQGCPSLPPNIT
jgi:hypothetical protein